MVDITRRNFHLSRKFYLKSSRKKLLALIQAIWNLIQLKSAKFWNSISELTSLFFQSLNELNSDPKYAIKRKFALNCYFPNKVPFIQADFSEGKCSCFKCLKARFHERKSWSKHSPQDIFFSIFATFWLRFLRMYLKAKPRHVFCLNSLW